MHATQAEIDAYYDRINSEVVRWSKLEYQKRIALQQNNKLLADFATVEDRDVKELLSHVISIGGEYIKELYRQQENNDDVAEPNHRSDLLKLSLDAEWWTDALLYVYPVPREREKTMLDLLTAAATFFKEML
jgi:hypothetical protein